MINRRRERIELSMTATRNRKKRKLEKNGKQ